MVNPLIESKWKGEVQSPLVHHASVMCWLPVLPNPRVPLLTAQARSQRSYVVNGSGPCGHENSSESKFWAMMWSKCYAIFSATSPYMGMSVRRVNKYTNTALLNLLHMRFSLVNSRGLCPLLTWRFQGLPFRPFFSPNIFFSTLQLRQYSPPSVRQNADTWVCQVVYLWYDWKPSWPPKRTLLLPMASHGYLDIILAIISCIVTGFPSCPSLELLIFIS